MDSDTERAVTALLDLRMRADDQGEDTLRAVLLRMKASGAPVVENLANRLSGVRAGAATGTLNLLREAGREAMPAVLAAIDRLDRETDPNRPEGQGPMVRGGEDRDLLYALVDVLGGLGSPGAEEVIRLLCSGGEAGSGAYVLMRSTPGQYSAARVVEIGNGLRSKDGVPSRIYDVLGLLPLSDAEWPAVARFVEAGGPFAKSNFLNSLANRSTNAMEVSGLAATVLRWAEDDEDVRYDVIYALVRMAPRDDRTLGLVHTVLTGESSTAQAAMLCRIGSHVSGLSDQAIREALRLSRSPDPRLQAAVMQMVGNCGDDVIDDEVAAEALRIGLEGESSSVRVEAVDAMRKRGVSMSSLVPVAMARCSGKGSAQSQLELLRAVGAAGGEWSDVEKQVLVAWDKSAGEERRDDLRADILRILRDYGDQHKESRLPAARLELTLGRREGTSDAR